MHTVQGCTHKHMRKMEAARDEKKRTNESLERETDQR